jgi:hypothetical protein
LIEINNIFAEKELLSVTAEEIQKIAASYKVNLEKKFQNELLEYYKKYLDKYLENNALSKGNISELNHIKEILNLKKAEVVFVEKTTQKFKLEVEKIVENENYNEEYFNLLMERLSISDELGKDIYKKTARSYVGNFLNDIFSEQRFSPEQEEKLKKISKNLNLNLTIEGNIKEQLDKCKLLWQIDNGNLPIENCGLSLQAKEICHYIAEIDWLEQRTVTKKVNYAGVSTRFRLAKGVYLRAGSIKPLRVTEDVWKEIDSGRVFVTNKRIIFVGALGNKTIQLGKILDFSVYSNGIEIEKDAGRSPFFQFNNNTDVFGLILANLLGISKDLPNNMDTSGLLTPEDHVRNFEKEVSKGIAAINAERDNQLAAIKAETEAKMKEIDEKEDARLAELAIKNPELAAKLKAIREESNARLKAIDKKYST